MSLWNNVSRQWRQLAFVVGLLLIMTFINYTPSAQPVAQASSIDPAQRAAAFTKLQQQAQNGPVAVIIQVRPDQPFQVESSLNDAAAQQQRIAIANAQDAVIQRTSGLVGAQVKRFATIPFFAATVDTATLAQLQADSQVLSIEEDILVPPSLLQSVPLIGATSVHNAGYRGQGITVAVLDTGVDTSHSAFSGAVVASACYSTNDSSYSATTVCPNGQTSQTGTGAGEECNLSINGCSHGTHVAGISVGRGSTITGVAPQANLINIQVFTRVNNDTYCGVGQSPCALSFTSDWVLGLEYVYSLRNTYTIASANMSLGGGQSPSTCDSSSSAATTIINQLRTVNIATVIAAGNSGFTSAIAFPACISYAVSVGATTKQDQVATTYSNSSSQLTLLAPGSSIYSSVPNNQYATYSGTSMAAPHVAGAWALMRQRYPSDTVSQTITKLQNSGVAITDPRNSITRSRIRLDELILLTPTATNTATSTATATATSTATATNTTTATTTSTTTATTTGTTTATTTKTGTTTATTTATVTTTATATVTATPITGKKNTWLPLIHGAVK